MRHRVYGKHLGRSKNQRQALFRSLVRSLILHESITTTATKAKAVKGLVDRIISKSKEESTAARTYIQAFLPDKQIVKKLVEEVAPRYSNRNSGFTQIARIGVRQGDGSMMVRMSLSPAAVKSESKAEEVKEAAEPKKVSKPKAKKESK